MKVTRSGEGLLICFRQTPRDQAAAMNLLRQLGGQAAVPTCPACGGMLPAAAGATPAASCRCADLVAGPAPYAKQTGEASR